MRIVPIPQTYCFHTQFSYFNALETKDISIIEACNINAKIITLERLTSVLRMNEASKQ